MSFLGRTLDGDMGWSARQATLVGLSVALCVMHMAIGGVQILTGSRWLALPHFGMLVPVFAAIFSGLPRARGPVVPQSDQGAYRSGAPAPAIEPRKVSHAFMDVFLTLFLAAHCLAVIGAVVLAIGALLVVGLVIFTCGKH